MKYLILVGDGMGDLPIPELEQRTVLEAADTPAMDQLCQRGDLFLTTTIPDGFPPGSDVANLSLMGYHPSQYYTGRAPLEAAAMGLQLTAEQTAFRCNLVTLKHKNDHTVQMIDYSSDHISTEESHQLIDALQQGCGNDLFSLHPGISYRHILLVKGAYPEMETVPPHDYIEKDVTEQWQRYLRDEHWQTLVMTAEKILKEHPVNLQRIKDKKNPANSIWLWGEGKLPTPPTLTERFGITGSLISAVDLLKGLGVNAGLDIINVPGATGYLDTNYQGKVDAALDALSQQDFVFVHVEAPDETGHQGLVKEKLQAIEDFDHKIVAPIVAGLRENGEDFRLIATMDHFTPVSLRTHTSSPVPTILYDSRETCQGSGLDFCEKNATAHDLHLHNSVADGVQLMEKLLEQQKKK